MKSEIQIDLKAMLKWIGRKWKLLIPGFVILAALMSGLLYFNEVVAYRHETAKLYSKNECLAHMSDSALREVNLTLAMEKIMKGHEDELEELRQIEEPTEEQYLRMEDLMENIDKIRSLSISYRYAYDSYQSRYYDLLNGVDENDIRAYPALTQNMVFGGIIIGAAMLVALFILWYLLSGYLHSEDEIRMNYGYRVNAVDATKEHLEDGVKLVLESDRWNSQSKIAILDAMDKKKESQDLEIVKKITGGEVYTGFLKDTGALAGVKAAGQAIIVAKVNDTKLRTLAQIHETMQSLGVDVLGVHLIRE